MGLMEAPPDVELVFNHSTGRAAGSVPMWQGGLGV